MRTFYSRFKKSIPLVVSTLYLCGCGILDAELKKFGAELTVSPPTSSGPSSYESVALTDSSILGKNKFLKFNSSGAGGTTLDQSGRLVSIESDGIHTYDDDGDEVGFISLNATLYPAQIRTDAMIVQISDGSFFVGGIPNGSTQDLLKISPTGVITPIPLVRTGYGFRDIKVIKRSNNSEEIHVIVPIFSGGGSGGSLSNLISVYDTNGNFIKEYGVEADQAYNLAQAPNGEIYTIASHGYQIFHYTENSAYIDTYSFPILERFDEIDFAQNGDMLLLRIELDPTGGVYRYSMPSMTLLGSITNASNPELEYPLDLLVKDNGAAIDINVGNTIRTRNRYTYAAGTFAYQQTMSSSGSGNNEFKFSSDSTSYNFSASDSNDNVYYIDQGNRRIQSFTNSGTFRFSRSIQDANVASFPAIAVSSTNQVIVIGWKTLSNGNLLLQKFTQAGTPQTNVDVAWNYTGANYIGIDAQDRLWFQAADVSANSVLVAFDLSGGLIQTININDTSTFFGVGNLALFRVAGSNIFALSLLDYKSWISDFSGNAELLLKNDEYVTADILAGLTSTVKMTADGQYYMQAIRNDMSTCMIVFEPQYQTIAKRLSNSRIDGNYSSVLTSLGLWQGLSDSRLMLLAF